LLGVKKRVGRLHGRRPDALINRRLFLAHREAENVAENGEPFPDDLSELGHRTSFSQRTPIKHGSAQAQANLVAIRARASLVQARTALVNAARGLVKSYGEGQRSQ